MLHLAGAVMLLWAVRMVLTGAERTLRPGVAAMR
jgi:hypothetical protein